MTYGSLGMWGPKGQLKHTHDNKSSNWLRSSDSKRERHNERERERERILFSKVYYTPVILAVSSRRNKL